MVTDASPADVFVAARTGVPDEQLCVLGGAGGVSFVYPQRLDGVTTKDIIKKHQGLLRTLSEEKPPTGDTWRAKLDNSKWYNSRCSEWALTDKPPGMEWVEVDPINPWWGHVLLRPMAGTSMSLASLTMVSKRRQGPCAWMGKPKATEIELPQAAEAEPQGKHNDDDDEDVDPVYAGCTTRTDRAMADILYSAWLHALDVGNDHDAMVAHAWHVGLAVDRKQFWRLFQGECPVSLASVVAESMGYMYAEHRVERAPRTVSGMAVWEKLRRLIVKVHGDRLGNPLRPDSDSESEGEVFLDVATVHHSLTPCVVARAHTAPQDNACGLG